jgi:N-acetylmuramoyl-L-alanine amidase
LAKKINRRYIEAQSVENTKNGGVKKASFVVIRNPEIPSCLIEIDFLTSPAGEEAILTPERRRMMSLAIADGIADWHENN